MKGGSGLVGQMVSGPLKTKIDKAWRMYRKISPHLKSDSTPEPEEEERERSQGRTIKFNVERPSPDFLIRHAKLSIRAFDQDLEGRFEDLSDQPKIHGKPFVLNLSGKDNAKFKQFSLKVVMDRTGPQAQDLLETRMDAFKFDAMEIGRLATLDKGLANITGRLKIGDEKNLKGHVTIQVQDASFAGRNGKDDEITRLIQKVLRSVNHFYLKVGLSGTADHYSLKIDSDLDAILTKAVRNIFDEKVKSFEADLKKSIGASTGLPLSETQDLVAGLKDYRKILKGSESDYNNLLRQATEKALLKKVPGGGLLDKFKLPF
ncbi:MAG: hypothetical protein GWN88_05950 [Nitrospinaceae bacterium]|nr:hypothetical protein [Nitrospinaceae bacterium]NIU43751.1 hypothetical protein [Nitrospinaceae bacterium]NIU95874.1 hypothetical protein [Nitrospinaceae bacterium]